MPARDRTYALLKRRIAELPADRGTFLTEGEIAEEAGSSRTPVREALLRLQAEGFVEIVPKRGIFVPPVSDSEIRAVMEARELIEQWSVRRVMPTAEPAMVEMKRLIESQRQHLDDPVRFIECGREFHRLIVQLAGNSILADFYDLLRDRQLRMGIRAVVADEERARGVLDEHQNIVEAIESGDVSRAGAAVAEHLASTRAALGR